MKFKNHKLFDKFIIWLFLSIFFFSMLIGVFIQENDCINSIRFVLNTGLGSEEKIDLFKQNDKCYLFLPSYVELKNVKVEYLMGCSLFVDGKYYNSETSFDELSLNKQYNMKIKNFIGMVVSDVTFTIYKANNVPMFSIKLDNNTLTDLNSDKETKRNAFGKIIKSDGTIDFQGKMSIKGRGNSTWGKDKKPYNIYLERSSELLNMNGSENWCLLSNPVDTSNMRNKIVYDAAMPLGLKYSIDSRFVDLYVNDQYVGLYLLTEKIEVGSGKVNITNLEEETQKINSAKLNTYSPIINENEEGFIKYYNIPNTPEDITGGYIIELEYYDCRMSYESAFTTSRNTCFLLKSMPFASKNQVEYIRELTEKIEVSIYNGDYEKYIDVKSWVVYYLIQESFGNIDSRSFFYYKDKDSVDSKIYSGPIWDVDVSLENSCADQDINPRAFYVNLWGWNNILYNNKMFYDYVVEEYTNNFSDFLKNLIEVNLEKYAREIEKSYEMNRVRWIESDSFKKSDNYESAQEQISHIKKYLIERKKFLDEIWIEGKSIYSVKATSQPNPGDHSTHHFFSINPGEPLNELPVLEYENYKFLGWYENGTDKKYVPGQIITKNMFFTAKWEKINNEEETVSETIVQKVKRIIHNNFYFLLSVFLFGMMGISILVCIVKDLKIRRKEVGRKNE